MFLVRRLAVTLVLASLTGSIGPAVGAPRGVIDEGKFFSAKAIEEANKEIGKITRDYGKDLLIDTVSGVPAEQEVKYKELGKQKFFNAWAEQRASGAGVRGIYILLSQQPGHLQIEVDKATRQKAFTAEDRNRLVQKMLPLLKQKKNDEALRAAVDTVASTIQRNGGRQAAAGGAVAKPRDREGSHSTSGLLKGHAKGWNGSILRWLLIGGGVLLAVWVVSRLFRARQGSAAGPGEAGGMPSPGGAFNAGGVGGGGGGGFLTSVLGGVFGAAAGSWLYDSVFRHGGLGGSEAYGAEKHGEAAGQGTGGQEAGAGDFSGDAGGGGDFGGDVSGGSLGGGDFGGSDFGGGDFGGEDF
jgi:hypothetical protein